ncbi:MAG: alanine racemase [Planctomycetota bacterium]|nr:alanine racemase [Planctomycetota bacterium]
MKELDHPSRHRAWLEIDLSAVTRNIRAFRKLVGPDRLLLACLKADAYGHGAEMAAPAAIAGGADRIGVATCLEGQMLREAGVGVPIQVLGASFPEEVRVAVKYNLTLSLHDLDIARLVAIEAARGGRTIPVHFKIDTGMGRLGILPEDAAAAAVAVADMPGLRFEGVFMHFADAEDAEYSRLQLERFRAACGALEAAGIGGFIRHAASSTAAVLFPESHFDMVRIGAGAYGYLSPGRLRRDFPLQPAMAWRSAVIQVKDYPPGSNLGYNRTFTTRRPTRVAVLPVGYADGYRRECSNRAEVLVRGRRAPVVGMISMDYTMVDITGIENVEVGCEATLLGSSRGAAISAEDLAEWAGTIPYCVTTSLGPRLFRGYEGSP